MNGAHFTNVFFYDHIFNLAEMHHMIAMLMDRPVSPSVSNLLSMPAASFEWQAPALASWKSASIQKSSPNQDSHSISASLCSDIGSGWPGFCQMSSKA